MILVDSNTWIYFLDETLPEHPRAAPRLRMLLEEHELLLTTVVQMEVAHYVVRHLGEDAEPALDTFFSLPSQVDSFQPDDVKASVRLLRSHAREGIGGRDATILHAAQKRGVDLLCTSDKPLAKAAKGRGIQARNLAA